MSENKMSEKGQTVFKEETAEQESVGSQKMKTSTGLEENIAGLLSYVFGAITGVIFLILEKDNRFIRFHALQSTLTFVVLLIFNFILTAIPIIGWLIGLLIAPIGFILWIVLMVKAYQGKWFKLPVIGEIAMNQMKKGNG
ncbi:DUF4870 domain-containing protein [Paenibacillus chungangensis]|uniref:DUF4870 domain-containing protein n=1 Tax=Paenibacillus chungangensis TaxID=696535 RepID=A0ABW3HUR9_9BACL